MPVESVNPRKVSYPPGETVYREFFYRAYLPDGTIRDTEPRRVGEVAEGPAEALVSVFRGMGVGSRLDGGRNVRMERTVTVTATEWAEVAPQPLVDEAKLAEAVTPQAGDPNDYCQRSLCGHARGFHPEPLGDGGPCERCGNPGKCPGFLAGPGARLLLESAKRGELLVTCNDGAVRRATNPNASGTNGFAGPAAEDMPADIRITLRSGEWVRIDG